MLTGVASGSSIGFIYDSAGTSSAVTSSAPAVVLTGTSGSDNLGGTSGDDFIDGLGGNDTINNGASGFHVITSGAGFDEIFLDLVGPDLITDFNVAEDILDVSNALTGFTQANLANFIEVIDVGGVSIVNIDSDGAATSNNFVVAAVLANVVVGDQVAFNAEAGGSGSISVVQSSLDLNVVVGTPVGETLNGTANDDVIAAFGGDDTLTGLAGEDVLLGGDGDDILDGGAGDDELTGGSGLDSFVLANDGSFDTVTDFTLADDNVDVSGFFGGAVVTNSNAFEFVQIVNTGVVVIDADGADSTNGIDFTGVGHAILTGLSIGDSVGVIVDNVGIVANVTVRNNFTGGGGTETINGTALADLIDGRGGVDTINGFDGDDVLLGFSDQDILDGGNGNDILVGGTNNDTLTGGSGLDRFVLEATSIDTITDFAFADDVLDLSALLDSNFDIGIQATYIQASTSGVNTTISVDFDGGGTGFGFQDAALLQNVGGGSVINFIFDDLGGQSSVVVPF